MIKQGRGGKIINFASQAGRRGEPLVAIYCSSKAAVISLTQSAGLDLIKHRINVNGIAPGVVDNEHWDHVDAMFAKYENLKPGEKSAPLERLCRSVVWRVPTRLAASRHSSQAKTPSTSWPRPTILTAATG
jgi:NAD(P)-dependent dehydrogenase (short-subunit alcohol dehydrogenase family)